MTSPLADNRLSQFTMLSVLGKGSFAKVVLVRNNSDGSLYALKSLDKSLVEEKRQEARVMVEKQILVEVSHPFIVRMDMAFQNELNLFLVL